MGQVSQTNTPSAQHVPGILATSMVGYRVHSVTEIRVLQEFVYVMHRLHTLHQSAAQSRDSHQLQRENLQGNNRASNLVLNLARVHRGALNSFQFRSKNLVAPSFPNRKWSASVIAVLLVTFLAFQRG